MIPDSQAHVFLIDPASGAEMARLLDLDPMVTEMLGGLFPQDVALSRIRRVLDLACGPGGWVQEVAFHHPDIDVTGIDISPEMVEYARALARVQYLDNADFRVMDLCMPLDLPDDYFDFIQGRFLGAALPATTWPELLQECVRVLHPGGIIRLTEAEWPDTNSPAVQHFGRIVIQVLQRIGRSFSPDGQHLGATEMLVPLLRDAGLTRVRSQVYENPFTYGLFGPHPIMRQVRIALLLMEPFLLKQGVISHEEFEALMRQMEWETFGENFHGTLYMSSAWGEKAR